MSETADTPEWLAMRLLDEGQKAGAFFEQLPPAQWNSPVYTEGACWTVRQVLAHFVATENAFRRLILNILEGGAGTPENFDLNAYNERKATELEEVSTGDLLQRFTGQRQETAALVAGLQPADLERTGRHPFLGSAPLGVIIKLVYRHNQIHIREIRAVSKRG